MRQLAVLPLLLVTALPLAGALIILLLNAKWKTAIRWVALLTSLAAFALFRLVASGIVGLGRLVHRVRLLAKLLRFIQIFFSLRIAFRQLLACLFEVAGEFPGGISGVTQRIAAGQPRVAAVLGVERG